MYIIAGHWQAAEGNEEHVNHFLISWRKRSGPRNEAMRTRTRTRDKILESN
jgi:hypothetical protein